MRSIFNWGVPYLTGVGGNYRIGVESKVIPPGRQNGTIHFAMGIGDEALILSFAFYNFGSSFYKIVYLTRKRTNPSFFVVQMVWKV